MSEHVAMTWFKGHADDRDIARRAVLGLVTPEGECEFSEIVSGVQRSEPRLDVSEIRAGVWSLLAGGELILTEQQRIRRP